MATGVLTHTEKEATGELVDSMLNDVVEKTGILRSAAQPGDQSVTSIVGQVDALQLKVAAWRGVAGLGEVGASSASAGAAK